MSAPEQQQFNFRVSAQLWASADISVNASSEEEARQKVAQQLNERYSNLTGDLVDSASVQIRKEMGDDEWDVDLEGVGPVGDDDA